MLRKRPLIFLHWYHHVTVLVYTWHAYKDHTASGRWFMWMNYTVPLQYPLTYNTYLFKVHAFMYSYYALRAARIRVPKFAAMLVTLLQILQMVLGIVIGVAIYFLKTDGVQCQHTWSNLQVSLGIMRCV